MAARKQQNRTNSDRTERTASGRTSARGGSQGAGSKKSAGRPRKVQEQQPEPEEFIRAEVVVLGSFAVAVLLFLSNFHLCGFAGDLLRSFQLGLFGLPGYIAPLALFVGTCFYQANRGNPVAVRKTAASVAVFFLLCGFSQMIFGKQPEAGTGILEYYRLSASSGLGGGLAGGLLFGGIRSVLGSIGAFLIMAVGMILCMVCITERSFVKAVKRHSDVAYQHAKEDMERRREIYAERQEERKRFREEQRVRGVNLSSTYIPPLEDEYLDDEPEDGYEDDYDDSYEEDYEAENPEEDTREDSRVQDEEPTDLRGKIIPVDRAVGKGTARTRRKTPEEAMEPDFADAEPDKASVFTGSISMPDDYRNAEPEETTDRYAAQSGNRAPSLFDADDDYDLEAAAKRLTASGFGQFEQAGEVFTGGARRVEEIPERSGSVSAASVTAGTAAAAMQSEAAAPARMQSQSRPVAERPTQSGISAAGSSAWKHEAQNQASQDDAPWEETEQRRNAADPDLQSQNPYLHPAAQNAEAVQENPYIQPKPSTWQEPSPEEYLPEPDTAYTVKTNQNTDFAIPEGSRRVVTAGGKVIETDTEALSKKLESTKRAEAARREAEQAENDPSVEQQIQKKEEEPKKEYIFPPLTLLKRGSRTTGGYSEQEYRDTAVKLQQTLRNFGVGVTVTNISCGPSVTRYELHPEQGVKVSKIVSLADDIKLSLAAEDIRIEAPIPGKSAVGIEVPNKEKTSVFLRDLLESDAFQKHPSRLAFAVGKDIGGQVVVTDIAKMPHLLIAGATGSGKSVCINTIIMSIIYKADPEDVKLIMVDPKVVELSVYNGIPHLLIPVVTDPKKASGALNWAVAEMTDRYKKFAKYGVRDLKGYNAKIESIQDIEDENKPKKMPQIVIIVDELADLMMVAPGEVEDAICRLAQLARAAGIHLVIATQRPSVNVITGLIKANVPSRIAFSVSSGVDSRTIIDMNGAEKLLGKGDMLFYPAGFPKPQRVQGAFVSDSEVQQVVDFLTEQGLTAQYSVDVENSMNQAPAAQASGPSNSRDEYFEQAGRFIIEKEKASIGMLQRMFKIGFNRAARIMDQLAEAGVVGEEEGTKPRKVLMTMEEFEQIL